MGDFLRSLERLEVLLQTQHPSMSDKLNPVLVRVQDRKCSASDAASVLSQYSLLPAMIVGFLTAGASRLERWTDVRIELERNIAEEKGSRTDGFSHYSILKTALLSELALDVSGVKPSDSTKHFLGLIRTGLADQTPAFVAGILYGLEDSAIPELTVVARLINEYAKLTGLEPPINLAEMSVSYRMSHGLGAADNKYSLNAFFASHLLDFEIGHKEGLASTLAQHITSEADIQGFEAGFEFVLGAMDQWWQSLSQITENASLPEFTLEPSLVA